MDGCEVIRLYRFLHALLVRSERRFVNLFFMVLCLVLVLPMTALYSHPESHRHGGRSGICLERNAINGDALADQKTDGKQSSV